MAHFKTAYLQREIIIDAAVKGSAVGAEDIKVGSLVKLTSATDLLPASIELTLFLADATHIIAQSDTTQEYGHVPVELRDYRPNYSVKATYSGNLLATSPVKKVALFLITDKSDIILSAGEAMADANKGGNE